MHGAFSEISRKLRAYPWSEVNKLYEVINVCIESSLHAWRRDSPAGGFGGGKVEFLHL